MQPDDERGQPPRIATLQARQRPDYGQAGHLAGSSGSPAADRGRKAVDAGRKAAEISKKAAGGARSGWHARHPTSSGAGESGLYRLIELHAFNAAGDTALAVSLAGTLFFAVPSDEARGQIALFLGITMLPFALMAPLIGPFLDRFRRGRRWAIGATMALRALGCWSLAGAVEKDSNWMLPRRA